jgi:hypothetical protein
LVLDCGASSRWDVDVGWLLERLEAQLAILLSSRIRVDLETAENLPEVFIDQQLIERALLNLVLNARDAMPAGGCATIVVAQDYHSTGRVRGGDPMIPLAVSISGSGMDETRLKMAGSLIFRPRRMKQASAWRLSATHGTPGWRAVDHQCTSLRTAIDKWLPTLRNKQK